MFSQVQVAQAAPGDGGGGFLGGPLVLMIAMLLIMYALIIRPQQRQQKEHQKMVDAIQRGDSVVTQGGIHGKVTGLADDIVTVEIADKVRVKINRSAIAGRNGITSASPAVSAGKENKS